MEKNKFDELIASTIEAREILKKSKQPSRSFVLGELNAKNIRSKFNLTQEEFATLLNISINTLRNWEQNRRKPEGPARVLLGIADAHPEIFCINYEKSKP